MIGERSKVAVLQRQIEQEAHHQRRAKPLSGRIDAALEEERSSHPNGDVERRDEAQIQPVRAVTGDPFAERAADPVRRNEYPLRSRRLREAQVFQLVDERIHVVRLTHKLAGGPHAETGTLAGAWVPDHAARAPCQG